MQKRLLFVYVLLFSYSGAVAHSIVPHHHHQTRKEAKEHHHDSGSHFHEESSKNDPGAERQPYFLDHASNADVTVNHAAIDNHGKDKKSQFAIVLKDSIIPFTIADHNIFHPPMDDRIQFLTVFYSPSLRAPPSLI